MCARKYAHKIPFILKFNHNEILSYPNTYDQTLFASIKQAFDMGAVAVVRIGQLRQRGQRGPAADAGGQGRHEIFGGQAGRVHAL